MPASLQRSLFDPEMDATVPDGPVQCLGLTFPNDHARRCYFLQQLGEKLRDEEVRNVAGFPTGSDENILRLSDPPYYTACPNPFTDEFVSLYGSHYDPETDRYAREPFAADVSEGKNDPIYSAHSYHTKVPHKAIVRYILHYTDPGDLVFDGFCGTGMTGVAAQLCGDARVIRSMGMQVRADGTIIDTTGRTISRLGARRAILNDLSPAATFIASNFNRGRIHTAADELMNALVGQLGMIDKSRWTVVVETGEEVPVAYIVWSDVFICNNCSQRITFWNSAVDDDTGKVASEIECPHCLASFPKRVLERPFVSVVDPASKQLVVWPELEPVLIGLTDEAGRTISERPVGGLREQLLEKHLTGVIPAEFPDAPLDSGWEMYRHGMGKHRIKTHLQLYVPSSAATLNEIWKLIGQVSDYELRTKLAWVFTGTVFRCSKFNRRLPSGGGAPITGVLYIPSVIREENPVRQFLRRLEDLSQRVFQLLPRTEGLCLQTGSLSTLRLPENSLDYAFVDPPFGSNIFYADMNFLWESWLGVTTNRGPEAIISDRALGAKKSIQDYGRLMLESFRSIYTALKPGRWLTVEFHNSSNAVWNVISEALQRVGFIIADVSTLDKKQKSFRQTTASGAVKQDLIISAYKAPKELEERFILDAGTAHGAWDFVRSHLRVIPTFVVRNGRAEVIAERQDYLLFDRMVAFHVQRGTTIPMAASEFYAGLRQRYPERDGMFFLPEQVVEYDRGRLGAIEIEQLPLFVSDEKSAIQWVRQRLAGEPVSYQDLSPLYMREAQRVWDEHEQPLELQAILDENFVRDEDGRWRVPDPEKEADLDQIRHRALMREFQQYVGTTPKLKLVRTEALRAGFKDCWQRQDYATIVQMAKRVPDEVIQEDPSLLMYYDNALMRTGR